MAKILLVEDDVTSGRGIEDWLKAEKHLVEWVTTGSEALLRLQLSAFDIILLDWELPDMTGVEIARDYRGQRAKTPILMMTARSTVNDKSIGFHSGVDDYLTKPFHPKELSLRIMALLRRSPDLMVETLRVGNLELDPNNYQVYRDGEPVRLLPKEFDLLAFLIRHPGQLFSAESLIQRVWPSDAPVSKELVKVYVTKLRAKVDVKGQPSLITNVHGRGYRLDPPADLG